MDKILFGEMEAEREDGWGNSFSKFKAIFSSKKIIIQSGRTRSMKLVTAADC